MLLRFRPEDGLHVLVRGRVSVYEQRGQMQLVAETMEPVGAGSLQLAFEQLKERLKAEGLFDADRKRPLPAFPRTVGIVTSPTGAVIRDFLNIVARRHSGLNVLISPVSVQGDPAPAEIEAAIAELNTTSLVDVIVLARGGGSLEDLAAFNSERVARAIASSAFLSFPPSVTKPTSPLPTSPPTFARPLPPPPPNSSPKPSTRSPSTSPTNATVSTAPSASSSCRPASASLAPPRQPRRVAHLNADHRQAQRLDDARLSPEAAISRQLRQHQRHVADLAAAVLRHDPRQALAQARERLAACRTHLDHSIERILHASAATLGALDARLHSLSPLAVLDRGYALVLDAAGALVRSTAQVATGDQVTTRLADGTFTSRVEVASPRQGSPPAQ